MRIAGCMDTAITMNDYVVQLLRVCTAQFGYMIQCQPMFLSRIENCVVQQSSLRYGMSLPQTRRCFLFSLIPSSVQCLVMQYPRLRRFLPLQQVYGAGAGSFWMNHFFFLVIYNTINIVDGITGIVDWWIIKVIQERARQSRWRQLWEMSTHAHRGPVCVWKHWRWLQMSSTGLLREYCCCC